MFLTTQCKTCNKQFISVNIMKCLSVLYINMRIKSWQLFFGMIDKSRRNMEIYKWNWMVLGALGCMNNAHLKKKLINDNIVLDVFIICQKLRHIQII